MPLSRALWCGGQSACLTPCRNGVESGWSDHALPSSRTHTAHREHSGVARTHTQTHTHRQETTVSGGSMLMSQVGRRLRLMKPSKASSSKINKSITPTPSHHTHTHTAYTHMY